MYEAYHHRLMSLNDREERLFADLGISERGENNQDFGVSIGAYRGRKTRVTRWISPRRGLERTLDHNLTTRMSRASPGHVYTPKETDYGIWIVNNPSDPQSVKMFVQCFSLGDFTPYDLFSDSLIPKSNNFHNHNRAQTITDMRDARPTADSPALVFNMETRHGRSFPLKIVRVGPDNPFWLCAKYVIGDGEVRAKRFLRLALKTNEVPPPMRSIY